MLERLAFVLEIQSQHSKSSSDSSKNLATLGQHPDRAFSVMALSAGQKSMALSSTLAKTRDGGESGSDGSRDGTGEIDTWHRSLSNLRKMSGRW